MNDGEPSQPGGVIPPEQINMPKLPKKSRDISGFGFHIHLEQRLKEPPRWYPFAVSGGAVLVALFFGGIVIALAGGNPFASYFHIIRASFGDLDVFSDTIVKATPLILVGLACSLAFRMRLWNIGAEGQFYLGAFGASLVVYLPILPENTSPWLFIPTMMVFGILAGALWGFIPGYLKAKFNVNEIISTLMMNYIAINWNDFFIFAVWGGGFQLCPKFPQGAWLPRLSDYAAIFPGLSGKTTHMGLLLALLAVVIVWFIIYRSRWGYEIRLIGDNPRAARYAGLNIKRNTILVMVVSGALAGLAGMSEISGSVRLLQGAISPGYGFTGIIIAWLSKLNPIATVLVSILFGALILGGREIQPSGIPKMIQGIILVCLIASDFLIRYRVSISRKGAEA